MPGQGRYVLGLDVGTTALKAVALERKRGLVAQVDYPHELRSPAPGWAEEDAEQWWRTCREAIRALLAQVPADEVAAIGVSGMVPAIVLLDATGHPLRPAILQNDARAALEVEELRAAVDEREFFRITGTIVNQQNVEPRWRWLCRHEPGVVEQVAHLCGSYDFIVFRLTGQLSLEENWAAESALYDIERHAWHQPYLERAGLRQALLPPVHAPTEVVGGVCAAVAAETGLRVGTPVVAGSADHVAAALAAGLTQQGEVLLKFGGAGDVLYCSDRQEPDPHFYFDYHDVPGLILINGCMASSGSLVKWFSRELAGGHSLSELDQEAAGVPAGADGVLVLPYFLGEKTPVFDPLARGVFAGVMLHHRRAHLYRAILEAVCYGFAHHLALLREAGRPIRRVYAADGGSRSALWMQIAADVVGEPVTLVAGEAASALGVAYVAAMGVGLFANWDEIARFIRRGPTYSPRAEQAAVYLRGFRLYRDLYRRLQPLFVDLARLSNPSDGPQGGESDKGDRR
ncbi:FGGY-family carbohydrate kinase [Thermogemmatispora sp.]|uniref:FGGY-family carbohydrate kinase n=1 Tax=Thermogemmatispora sp. TaxID=1968838 RepID=UPI0035E40ED3